MSVAHASPAAMLVPPRPAGIGEIVGALRRMPRYRRREPVNFQPLPRAYFGVLHRDPLIVYSPLGLGHPLGLAGLAHRHLEQPATFLVFPWWSIERPAMPRMLRHFAVLHRLRRPHHRIVFLGNTEAEVAGLQEAGEAAIYLNQNCTVSDRIFRPLDGAEPVYDAIYNARLSPFKRHELTMEIESCAFVFYRATETTEIEQAAIARHANLPGHHFINGFAADGEPAPLDPPGVNAQLNRARVGLCLSAAEGANYASVEYLLAGLPVVSTPSVGGREVYFDPEFCVIAQPDPRAVREAVAALAARQIPRDVIHRRTLERLERDRRRFVDLLNELLVSQGAAPAFDMPWPFTHSTLIERHAPDAIEAALADLG